MATITYQWINSVSAFFMNDTVTAGVQRAPAIGAFQNGSYFGAWTDPNGSLSVQGRVVDTDGTPIASQFTVNSTITNVQSDPSIAGLTNGRAVVTFTDLSADPGGDIRARLFTHSGTAIDLDFGIDTSANNDSNSDVVALSDGGFAVTWQRDFGGGDIDVRLAIFNADGSARNGSIPVNISTALNTSSPSVAALKHGKSVVAWEQSPAAGGDIEIWFQRYDKNGDKLGPAGVIDSNGFANNDDIQLVGLKDGGFVAAYASTLATDDGTEINLRFFNADGSERNFAQANEHTLDNQNLPSLTVLSNGYLVVGWHDDANGNLWYHAFDPDGNAIGHDFAVIGGTNIEAEIVALTGGLVANVRASSVADAGGDQSIRSSVSELVRTTTGNGTSETLTGDSLRDKLVGKGGDDSLNGGSGNDTLKGGDGNDTLNGGSGADTLVGAAGHDRLLGNAGADSFVYSNITQSGPTAGTRDAIVDFHHLTDILDVSAIDAKSGANGNQAFHLITGGFTAAGQILVVQSGADAIVSFNTTGSDDAEMVIVLQNFTASELTTGDFIL